MPDESCRKCGGLLLDFLVCGKCRTTIQFICRICGQKTIPRFHEQICFRLYDITRKNNIKITNKACHKLPTIPITLSE